MDKRIEYIKEALMCCVENQIKHLDEVDAEELGEAVDMLKDLAELEYYCTVTRAMEDYDEDEESKKHYSMKYPRMYRDMDRDIGKMYYDENPNHTGPGDHRRQYTPTSSDTNNNSSRQHGEMEYNLMRD
jgi:hypothetical protein